MTQECSHWINKQDDTSHKSSLEFSVRAADERVDEVGIGVVKREPLSVFSFASSITSATYNFVIQLGGRKGRLSRGSIHVPLQAPEQPRALR